MSIGPALRHAPYLCLREGRFKFRTTDFASAEVPDPKIRRVPSKVMRHLEVFFACALDSCTDDCTVIQVLFSCMCIYCTSSSEASTFCGLLGGPSGRLGGPPQPCEQSTFGVSCKGLEGRASPPTFLISLPEGGRLYPKQLGVRRTSQGLRVGPRGPPLGRMLSVNSTRSQIYEFARSSTV